MNNTMFRFEPHSHTEYSNFRLIDCINRLTKLIDRAQEIGLSGIAITDHETLAGHMKANLYAQEILKKNPNFKIALGNEIYLNPTRDKGQKYYHFILIAKNEMGHRALRELSSRAWMCSFIDRRFERVVTLYDDIEEIVAKYPNSLIATTACLGGELSSSILDLINCETVGDEEGRQNAHNKIVNFILWCKNLFKDDFYIECAPGCSKEQIAVNKRLLSISKCFDIPMVIGTDAHYLKAEDRYVHKAYLNSKDGDREVDAFYEYSYLQTEEEIFANLRQSGFFDEFISQMFTNSMDIYDKIENFSLSHKQTIPKVEVPNYEKNRDWVPGFQISRQMHIQENYPILQEMLISDNNVERYWVNQCLNKLVEKNLYKKEYLDRLEEEADIKKTIGEKLGTNMFAYPVTLQHYVDMFWECGSMVGAGRGSSCSGLNHYLLGITQLDPIQWNLPFWRYLNKERVELGDIDLDLCPSKRPAIIKAIKAERGKNFLPEIDFLSRENLGCTLIATYGTEGTRSAILTSCRGYRSEEFPEGIDVDIAQYLTSLIPVERGFLWSLTDVVKGNSEKDRKPVTAFVNEIKNYPGLLDIMLGIEGLVKSRGSHASGVILFDGDPYEFGCFMRTPKGEIITQYDLHMCEAAGMTKYDFLVTEVQDKLAETIKLLQKYNQIDANLTLKEVYDKYFHPSVLPLEDQNIWESLCQNNVLNIFQFDSDVGAQAAKKIKPHHILEMTDANGLMRLMTSEKGEETPMEKYIRFKNNISLWYQEMDKAGLTKEEQKVLEPYFLQSYGVPPSQEQLMMMLMDKDICNFTLAEANNARKIVGKKQMSKIPELKEKVLNQAKSSALGQYVWDCGIGPQMGYSFSIIHALAYSFIGFQTMFIANRWNPIFWNTACLIVNSAALEEDEETYDEDEVKRDKSTNYAKLAKAIGDIRSRGIKVSLININKSDFGFEPDVDNNEILFGLKALSGINAENIDVIIANRPYTSLADFMNKCPLEKRAMISLIKGGAFDLLTKSFADEIGKNPRMTAMAYYLMKTSDLKKRITLQNFNGLMQKDLIHPSLEFQKRVFTFNKFLKTYQKVGKYYVFNKSCEEFYNEFFDLDNLEVINGITCILQSKWDDIYKKQMDSAREWIKSNHDEILKIYNAVLLKEAWDKYAEGNISAWEMSALCFYYHDHELLNVKTQKYGIVDFNSLPTEPVVEKYFGKANIPIYKTYKIIGTVISKNDNRSSVALLTTTGVVTVKFTKEYYAMFGRQISEKQADGTKKVIEKGWFRRGVMLMCTGFRRDDMFITKKYKHTPTHQLYKINKVYSNGEIELVHERYSPQED